VRALLRSEAASLRAALSGEGGGGGGTDGDPTRWRGHRTLLVDGSGTLAPDTPDNRAAYDALPDDLAVRQVRYRVAEPGRRTRVLAVVTTLLDPARYPRDAVAELYGIRWRVETHFRDLEAVLGMDRLKCRTGDGVRKELAAYALAYNLVRAVTARAAARQGTTPDRVSFADALRWLAWAEPGEALAAPVLNPRGPGRYEPRVVKRTRDTFPKMTTPRRRCRPHKRGVYKRRLVNAIRLRIRLRPGRQNNDRGYRGARCQLPGSR
jgi:hypothetical protein